MAMPYFGCGTILHAVKYAMQQASFTYETMQQPVVLIKEDPTFALFSRLPSRIIV